MLIQEQEIRHEEVMRVAKSMLTAARTAPKGRGLDHLEMAVADGDDLRKIALRMRVFGQQTEQAFFIRDAENVENSQAVVLIGVKIQAVGINCSWCGEADCAEKELKQSLPCAFNLVDLGIALGSAVSLAGQARVDNRIMYSVGRAAKDLGYRPSADLIFGIPLSVSGKSPFFDRK